MGKPRVLMLTGLILGGCALWMALPAVTATGGQPVREGRQAVPAARRFPNVPLRTGMVRYGDETTGSWAGVPVTVDAGSIARSVMRLVEVRAIRVAGL